VFGQGGAVLAKSRSRLAGLGLTQYQPNGGLPDAEMEPRGDLPRRGMGGGTPAKGGRVRREFQRIGGCRGAHRGKVSWRDGGGEIALRHFHDSGPLEAPVRGGGPFNASS